MSSADFVNGLLSKPSFSEMSSTEKRFAYILPDLIYKCADIDAPTRAGDMIAATYQLLDKAGLGDEENLFSTAKNVHRLTIDVAAYAAAAQIPLKCKDIWSLYVSSRQNGRSETEAINGVAGIAKAIYGLAK